MKKETSAHMLYFSFFVIVSLFYILNGYAMLGTNDDWALWGMLNYKGIYGTLIMSYPGSFIVSKLYDIFPFFPWYSILLSFIIILNFYAISIYIKNIESFLQKIALLIVSFFLISYFWLNATITSLTVLTMLISIGLINKNLKLSFVVVFLAFLLRSDIMFVFIPFYMVSYFILKDKLKLTKSEVSTLVTVIILITLFLFLQSQDKFYINWMQFNKARSAIVDLAILNVDKNYFSIIEKFCYQAGWLQDLQLLSTKKLIATSPSFTDVLSIYLNKIDIINFVKYYKFKYWLWLLLGSSFIALFIAFKEKRVIFILFFVVGAILLLIVRDVHRVTVPLMVIWGYVLFEVLNRYKILSTLFSFSIVYVLYIYMSAQFNISDKNISYYKSLQKEAKALIKDSNKVCEISLNFPTNPSDKLNTVFIANYLFDEDSWIKIDNKEILPTGWLVRNRFFYETHNLSDTTTKRKYKTYHDFLIDNNTAFFGSKSLTKSRSFNYLLKTYDKLYLKDKPNCKHKTAIIKSSKNFAISQVQVVCK
jgi:hypothetical protein